MEKYCAIALVGLIIILALSPLIVNAEDTDQEDEPDVVDLDEIVVSATRTPTSLDNISASSVIVTEKQIRSSTATDLGHLLETANILTITNYGPGGIITASMRGSSREQVLVLVDGERINDSRNGGVDMDNIPISYAQRIEIIRGGQSAIYGADAVGGIINIITRQPRRTPARAWSTLGAYGSASWGLEASKQVKAVSGLVSFSQMSIEADFPFEDKFGNERVRENSDYTKRSIFAKLRWDISDSANLRLSGDHYYSDKGDPGTIGQYSPDANKQDESNGLRGDLEQNFGDSASYKLSVYRRDATLRYTNPQQFVNATHRTDAIGTELQMHLLKNTAVPLVWGIYLRNDDVTSTALGDRDRQTYSAYAQQELGKDLDHNVIRLRRIAVFPAIRWDHYSDFEAGTSPKFGFLASFGQYRVATIRANIGNSYRAPTLNELYWPTDAYAFGNPDLKPESSKDADMGLHLHFSEPSILPRLSQIRCGISYFRTFSRDRIDWIEGAGGLWSPQNLPKATSSKGLEADLNMQVSFWNVPDLLSMGANYTLIKAENILGKQLIYRPKHSLGYTIRVGTGKFWGQVKGLYLSRRYIKPQNTKWLDPFMKHELQLGVERRLLNIANIGITFEVRNIFDTRYQLAADYPLPGREWSIRTSIGMKGE